MCLYAPFETCVLGAQKNSLIETVLLITHSIYFGLEKKSFVNTHSYLEACCHLKKVIKCKFCRFQLTLISVHFVLPFS